MSSLEPNSIQKALLDPNFIKAMEEKYYALYRNHTWDLLPFSSNMNLIDCKWVFKIKYNSDGSILKYKAWLVAKGFLQTLGVDFTKHSVWLSRLLQFESYFLWLSPLARISSRLMSRIHFLMRIYMRQYLCHSLKVLCISNFLLMCVT